MSPANARLAIMLVDDDDDDILLISHSIKKSLPTAIVTTCENGEALLDALQTLPKLPDLILLDLNMHCMDGRETLKALKSQERTMRIPVIILTTSKNEEDMRLCHELGASTFFIKPKTSADYANLIASLTPYLVSINEPRQPT